jgi:hypothetical protein
MGAGVPIQETEKVMDTGRRLKRGRDGRLILPSTSAPVPRRSPVTLDAEERLADE